MVFFGAIFVSGVGGIQRRRGGGLGRLPVVAALLDFDNYCLVGRSRTGWIDRIPWKWRCLRIRDRIWNQSIDRVTANGAASASFACFRMERKPCELLTRIAARNGQAVDPLGSLPVALPLQPNRCDARNAGTGANGCGQRIPAWNPAAEQRGRIFRMTATFASSGVRSLENGPASRCEQALVSLTRPRTDRDLPRSNSSNTQRLLTSGGTQWKRQRIAPAGDRGATRVALQRPTIPGSNRVRQRRCIRVVVSVAADNISARIFAKNGRKRFTYCDSHCHVGSVAQMRKTFSR